MSWLSSGLPPCSRDLCRPKVVAPKHETFGLTNRKSENPQNVPLIEILPTEKLVMFSVVIYRRSVHSKPFKTKGEIPMCSMAIFTVELLMCFKCG